MQNNDIQISDVKIYHTIYPIVCKILNIQTSGVVMYHAKH